MGLFSRKSESVSMADLLSMDDKTINKALKGAKLPYKNAKELRAAAKSDRRKVEGEKGVSALLAGMKGGGTDNYKNIPLRDRVHPWRYEQILHEEAKKQGLI